jgi:hypothetical protein
MEGGELESRPRMAGWMLRIPKEKVEDRPKINSVKYQER